ncbi:hypothetical protein L249_1116, partial [Ophiocordyceps polyrhachis-furcata BCC 54312]
WSSSLISALRKGLVLASRYILKGPGVFWGLGCLSWQRKVVVLVLGSVRAIIK